MPLFATIPTGKPWTCANPWEGVTQIRFSYPNSGDRKHAYRHDSLSVFLLELAEAAPVYHARNYLPHVEWLAEVRPDYSMKFGYRIKRILWDGRGLGKSP